MAKEIDHGARAHAILSASGSVRWLNCTPSPRLEEGIEESTSPYAAEGTLAHEFADIGLQLASGKITEKEHVELATPLRQDKLYTNEMEDQVQKYVDYMMECFNVANKIAGDAVLSIEQKLDLTDYIEESFGTNDGIVIADGILDVGDLKYGKGLVVHAKENPQLMIYGLGALAVYELMYDIHTIRLHIIQPRLNHTSVWEISVKDLLGWANKILVPAAKKAFKGDGVQKAGSWCRFCKVKARCATLAAQNLKMAQDEFTEDTDSVHFLKDDQILDVYKKLSQITGWALAVKDYVKAKAIGGHQWPGYKLVEGQSRRTFQDPDAIIKILRGKKHPLKDITATKLLGISAIEKLVGKKKFYPLLGQHILKPAGPPTLVEASDPRTALGLDTAKEEFGEDLEDDLM